METYLIVHFGFRERKHEEREYENYGTCYDEVVAFRASEVRISESGFEANIRARDAQVSSVK